MQIPSLMPEVFLTFSISVTFIIPQSFPALQPPPKIFLIHKLSIDLWLFHAIMWGAYENSDAKPCIFFTGTLHNNFDRPYEGKLINERGRLFR
jgi:hypothetical protein